MTSHSVTVTSEDVRRLMQGLLWNRSADAMGEDFHEEAYWCAGTPPECDRAARWRSRERVAAFLAGCELVDALDRVELGDTIEVDADFVECVRDFLAGYLGVVPSGQEEEGRIRAMEEAALAVEAQLFAVEPV